MTTFDRRQSLIKLLSKQSGMRVPELAKVLGVSDGTVRNDLNSLEEAGKLKRVHGGAVLITQEHFQSNSFMGRYEENTAAKLAIAREVAKLIQDGDSILLDASSTNYFLARALFEHQKLRVVTNGFEVARELASNPTSTVILIGGVVNNDSSSATGLLSEKIIEELHIQKAFFSCSGFSMKRGMTEVHLGEAQLKRKAIESSEQVYALVDSSKFGQEDLTPFASLSQITHLFTDSGISDEWAQQFQSANMPFTTCKDILIPD